MKKLTVRILPSLLCLGSLLHMQLMYTGAPNSYRSCIERIKHELQYNKSISRQQEKLYCQQLRHIYMQDGWDGPHGREALNLLARLRERIRHEYSFVTDKEYHEQAHGSVGVALARIGKTGVEEIVNVLIREAQTISASALIMLNNFYLYSVTGLRHYDQRILEVIRTTAQEGIAGSQVYYGNILLYGYGIEPNEKEAVKHLEMAGEKELYEAYRILVCYYWNEGDKAKVEKYLRLGAAFDDEKALYNLGVIEQEKGNYKEAVSLFERTLACDPQYYAAQLELARMYDYGWGVSTDTQRAFRLMKEVAEKAIKDKETQAIAYTNLGIFYQLGRGTVQSVEHARTCFLKAVQLGYTDAQKYLQTLKGNK